MPSSGGVYHWASITAGQYGRQCGWFAGWWNFLAWIFGAASMTQIISTQTMSAYALFHPGFHIERWHIFVTYIICSWFCCLTVALGHRLLPKIEALSGCVVVGGFLVTVVVCAVMPYVNDQPYADNNFVWSKWQNHVGYSSDGFVFCLGMLNGAFAVGAPDVTSHIAEEVLFPSRNVPLGTLIQYIIGFITALCYAVVILYGINDLDRVLNSPLPSPLAEIYRQTTGTRGGAFSLLIVSIIPTFGVVIGCYLICGRTLWTLARDNATPYSHVIRRVHTRHRNPMMSTLVCGMVCTLLGCIYVGNDTAFGAFVGSYVVLTTLSYLAAVMPHLLNGRSNTPRGWFWMRGALGYIVNGVACAYTIIFIVIFCFPASVPVDASSMNYTCLITGGLTAFIAAFWFWRQRDYVGPTNVLLGSEMIEHSAT
ncbi:amino acid/polyamine transporter I [Aspergillus taichungensis]|uniref:Amino acid/polyamine transporter I n=1 Tax=Aspergillus taichungensis TaxID=482145 RepID=A0A2J5HUV5_9EURO|nr:amino acid/polyamine transporter I [Aspergillus taichungensis]